MPENTEGFFYALINKDVALPCIGCNGLYSSDAELAKGRGDIPIYCLHRIFISMLKNATVASATQLPQMFNELVDEFLSYREPGDYAEVIDEMLNVYVTSEDFVQHSIEDRRKIVDCFKEIKYLINRLIVIQEKRNKEQEE